MSDIHITQELLRAVARGDVPARALVEVGLQHLTTLCPSCREEYSAWRKEVTGGVDPGSALKLLPVLIARHSPDEEKKRRLAERDFEDLLRTSHRDRLLRIRRSINRFRGTILGRLLLDASKEQIPAYPGPADELAETAEAVLSRTPDSPGLYSLMARAAVLRANVCRIRGNPGEARKRFDFARSLIRSRGVADPLIVAEADMYEGFFHLRLRRFIEAEELLNRSITFFILGGDREAAGHPLVTLGLLYYEQGDSSRAVEATRSALRFLDPKRDPRLFACARFNIALFLCEGGDHCAAREALLADREVYGQFPDAYTQLRVTWLEGKIAAGSGDLEEAEKAYSTVRQGFLDDSRRFDAAMVSLDLALVFLRQGRTAELMDLADEIYRLFAAEEVQRETLAALLLFKESAREAQLTAEIVQKLIIMLREVAPASGRDRTG